MAQQWQEVEEAAKNDAGQYQAFIGGQWKPVAGAAKNESGKYMALMDAEEAKQETKPETTPVEKSRLEKTGEFFTKGEEDHQFSMADVNKSMAAGAVIGGGVGAVAGGVGAIPGAIGGAAIGAASGFAGEAARTMGSSPAVAMATEFAAGGLSSVGRQAASILSKAYFNLHTKAAARDAIKLGEEFGAPSVKGDIISQKVKSKILGEKPTSIPVKQTEHTDLVNKSHEVELAQKGIPVKQGERPTDALRENIYDNMTQLTKQGNPFSTSPDMIALHSDLQTLVQRNLMSKEQVSTVIKIMQNQTSKNPNVAAKANEDILSLLQSGGIYSAKQDMKQTIGKEAQSAIRGRVEQYYKGNLGKNAPGFEELKMMEKQGFQAKAIDSIPAMVRENFKDVTSKEFKENMMNIANSGVDGKMAFAKAVSSHFSDKAPEDFLREFNRLRKPLQESGVMDAQALDHLRVTLEHIPKDIVKERWKQMAIRAFQGIASAEIHKTEKLEEVKQ